jgi:cytochrome c biogenesis protein CcmG/thiol:disulfide interchange protein DsbE
VTTSARPAHGALLLVLLAVLATACSQTGTSSQTYVFKPDTSAIKVDTPALRAEKAAAGIAACPKQSADPSSGSESMPNVTLPCLGGGRDVNLAKLRGTPTVVNFWAQTCGPCRQESPILERLYRAAGSRVRILGVDWQDSQPGLAIAFARQLGLTYPQIADPDAATRRPLHIAGLPMTVFLDSSGRIMHATYGALGSVGQLAALVSRYLGVNVHIGSSHDGA